MVSEGSFRPRSADRVLTRRRSLLQLGLLLGSASPIAIARVSRARVGWLSVYPPQASTVRDRSHSIFVLRMQELGWNEGDDFTLELRGRLIGESLETAVKALVASNCDVLISRGTEAVKLLRDASADVPIVMAGVGDPVGTGLIKSLARPGGNVTGVSMVGQELFTKIVSRLRDLVPGAKRVDLLTSVSNPASAFFARVVAETARSLGLANGVLEVRRPDELERTIAATPADALVVNSDPTFFDHLGRMATAARRRRLPMACNDFGELTRAGGLFSYSPDGDEITRQVADYTDRILRGAKPADLPVAQPRRYRFVVNLDTARTLGLVVPGAQLALADEVIR